MTDKIKSKDNALVKEIAKLSTSAKMRRESGLYVCEGVRLCCDAVLSGVRIKYFLYTAEAYEKNKESASAVCQAADRCYEADKTVFRKMCDTDTPQGFLCVIQKDSGSILKEVKKGLRYAALERIQDPSNLGTILRTAEAMGLDGVILSSDCCDIYSPKVVRGSMGAVFRLPFMTAEDFTGYVGNLGEIGIRTYASTPRNAKSVNDIDFSEGGVMLIGNEGNGLTDKTIAACTERVMIPMKGRAESLNASAAAAILLYQLTK